MPDGEERRGRICSCILPIACWLESMWEGSKAHTKTFICLREILQLWFSRDAFPPVVIYKLGRTNTPLCWRWATVQKPNAWSVKPEGSWFCSPFNGGLGEQCWVLGPISSACVCISCNDFFGWKTHAVSEADTIADCKVVAHQLKQGMFPTYGIIAGWFHHSWRHKGTIYTIFGGKMPRICVSTSSVSCVTPGCTAGDASLLCSQLCSVQFELS